MRYSSHLRVSTRQNILKKHLKSSLISLGAILLTLAIIAFFIRFSHLNSGRLINGLWVSLARMSIAYVISLVIALVLAFVITVNQKVENLTLPIFDVLQSFPSFALFPVLATALVSMPEAVIISVLVISIIWPILFTIIGGIKNRREDLEEAARIFGAKGFKRLRYYRLPELFPSIVTGSIVGWGDGWELIIGAELLVQVHNGIGAYLGDLGQAKQNALLAFGIVVLMLFLFLINKILWLPLLRKSTEYTTES